MNVQVECELVSPGKHKLRRQAEELPQDISKRLHQEPNCKESKENRRSGAPGASF